MMGRDDPTAALQIAKEMSIPPERFLYRGDTNTSMQITNAADIYSAGVLWAFRTVDELIANGAKILLKIPQDLLNLLDPIPLD